MRRLSLRLVIVTTLIVLWHFYVWQRLVDAPGWPAPWRTLGTIAIVMFAPSLHAAMYFIRRLARPQAAPLLWVAYTWFGFSTYLLLAVAVSDVVRVFAPVSARGAAVVVLAAAVATTLYGLGHVARGPRVREVRVALAKLPASAAGYKIVQLTDVHIGPLLGRRFAREVVRQVNALAPDLIVITGDLVDGRLDELREHAEPLRELRARDGVFAVTGNHEYYWNVDAWLRELAGLGLRFLRNEHVTIAGAFELAGVDDVTAVRMARGHGEDIPRALAGRDPALPVVLLAHHPSSVARAVTHGVDLQLSGHTHGGQLLPWGWLSRLFEPRVAGLARFERTWLYVSEGTGFWGPPMRVGTTGEISVITLAPASA